MIALSILLSLLRSLRYIFGRIALLIENKRELLISDCFFNLKMFVFDASILFYLASLVFSALQIDDERTKSLFAPLFGMFWDESFVNLALLN